MVDVLNLLEADHRRVEGLLESLADSDEGPRRNELVIQLIGALEVHMAFEEGELYPLLQQIDQELEQEAETEHTLTRDGLQKLRELAAAPGFGAVVDMVTAGVAHHVTEEEDEAFPKLRDGVDDATLEALAVRLTQAKRETGVLDAELGDATKDQLLVLAQVQDLEGRSSMSVDELRAALAE